MTLYVNAHRSQYAAGSLPVTRRSGCTWTSAANGADAQSGGAIARSADYVHALVAPGEETNPTTPGWSVGDADLAMRRLGVPFDVRSGGGWAAVEKAWDDGLYVLLQGDSDQFGNATCSGVFDGDHAIGGHPWRSGTRRWIDDPICPNGRWEEEAILRRYAEKLAPSILFGVFTNPVPTVGGSMRYVMADGYDVDSGLRINVGKGTRWYYLDGSAGGEFSEAGPVVVAGLGDSTTGEYVIRIGTGRPYDDKITRDTLVLLRSTNRPFPAPVPAPINCDKAVNQALDHVEAAVAGVTTAINEARPR